MSSSLWEVRVVYPGCPRGRRAQRHQLGGGGGRGLAAAGAAARGLHWCLSASALLQPAVPAGLAPPGRGVSGSTVFHRLLGSATYDAVAISSLLAGGPLAGGPRAALTCWTASKSPSLPNSSALGPARSESAPRSCRAGYGRPRQPRGRVTGPAPRPTSSSRSRSLRVHGWTSAMAATYAWKAGSHERYIARRLQL